MTAKQIVAAVRMMNILPKTGTVGTTLRCQEELQQPRRL
jgi:hypothetical protein